MADRGREFTYRILMDSDQMDTAQASRGLEDVGDAAQDTQRQVDDMGRALADAGDDARGSLDRASSSARDLGDSSRAAGDDATTSLDRATSAVRDFGDTARTAGDDASRSLEDAGEAGSGAFGDMRDEAGAALMELAGSFDGTMTSVLDTVQGAVAPIGAFFGPVGLAIGSAVGIGIGAIRAQTEALKEDISSLTTTLIGDAGKIQRESVLAKVAEFAETGEIETLAQQARDAKVDVDDYILSLAGDPEAIKRIRAEIDAYRNSTEAKAEADTAAAAAASGSSYAFSEQATAIGEVDRALGKQGDALASASARYDLYSSAERDAIASTEDAVGASGQLASALAAQGSALENAAAEMVRRVQIGLNRRPLEFRTRIDPSGYESGLRTIVRNGSVNV